MITGQAPAISTDKCIRGHSRVFLIGNAAQNPATGSLLERESIPANDGFIIKSVKEGSNKYTVLAGRTGVSSLYATYDYLERFCKVGFFEDGEYVPHMSTLPFKTANTRQKPYFRDRHYLVLFGHWGIKKFHAPFWTLEEWKRELDFLAKKKINLSRMHMRCSADPPRGDVPVRAFPEIGPMQPGYSVSGGSVDGGWPNTYNWPEEYRTRLTKDILDYGRKLGIKFIYWVSYGDIPVRFKAQHPEIDYMPDNQYGPSTQIRPNHPMAYEVTKKYLKELIKTFGTDHMYFDTPYAESAPGANPDETLRMKTSGMTNLCKVLKEVDPKAVWVWDTWDFTVSQVVGNGDVWTKQNIKRYIDATPMGMSYIFDNNSDLTEAYPDDKVDGKILPMYLQHDFFDGRKWAFAVLHSYAGDDTPHGRIDYVMDQVKSLAKNPKAANCVGFFTVSEKVGDNDLYYQLLLELAWNPSSVDKHRFFSEYAERRFGRASAENMKRSTELIAQAVLNGPPNEMNYCYYKMLRCYLPAGCPIFDGTQEIAASEAPRLLKKMELLYSGLQAAFQEKDRQRANKLYENYIVEYGKHYLAELCNFYMIQMYAYFKVGDSAGFETSAEKVGALLDVIQSILGSRPDYVLKNTISRAMSVPGTNPATPALIRQGTLNDNYTANDNYEQMVVLYRPRVDACIQEMRRRMGHGVSVLKREDLQTQFSAIVQRWRSGDLPEVSGKSDDVVGTIEAAIAKMNHKGLSVPSALGLAKFRRQ
ncbi:MAG: alpha-N-acetylglucosaminidase TIM-barrel domain-containing protein [Armatimonadota bacterium]